MCSASQPSSRAITEAMRSAKHFLPSSALPPYPEPYDQISRVSGKCTIHFSSVLQGHGDVGLAGGERRADRVHARHELAVVPSTSSAAWPARVIVRMLTRDVGGVGDLDADVRERRAERAHAERHHVHGAAPHRAPEQAPRGADRISAGSCQLLVGPASASSVEQMKVRSSTRATSLGIGGGPERAGTLRRVELDEGARVDELLAEELVLLVGPVEPVDVSGSHSSTISSTQRRSFGLRVGGAFMTVATAMVSFRVGQPTGGRFVPPNPRADPPGHRRYRSVP